MVSKVGVKILSIDWDYFFSDQSNFDWSMNENNFLYYDFIWSTRAGAWHMVTKEKALDVMVANQEVLKGFWDKVCPHRPLSFIVAESHLMLFHYLKAMNLRNCSITNFDAHHDCGYHKNIKDIHCGNWVYHGIKKKYIGDYKLIYPEWRVKSPEPTPTFGAFTFGNLASVKPEEYDIVFVCRSSCWTPSWCDDEWLKFINARPCLERLVLPQPFKEESWLLTPRKLNMEEAKKAAEQQDEIFRQMREQHANLPIAP
jgi:hypothetical protein